MGVREGRQFAEYHGLKFVETSAITGQNVEEAFMTVTADIYRMLEEGRVYLEEGWDGIKQGYSTPHNGVSLDDNEEKEGSCC